MANLTDTINASGQTAEADEQEQAAQAGAQAGLMTPLFGQTFDQAKMMGTQAQKTSSLTDALRYGIQEGMDLQDVQRRSDWTRQAEGQPGQDADVTDWANIANISTNVQQMTDAAIQQAMEEAASTMNQEAVSEAIWQEIYDAEGNHKYFPADSQWSFYNDEYNKYAEEYAAAMQKLNEGKYVSPRYLSQVAGKRATAARKRWEEEKAAGQYRQAMFDRVWEGLQSGADPETYAADMMAVKEMLGAESDEDVMEALAVNLDEIEMGKALTGAEIFPQGVDEDGKPTANPLMAQIATTLGLENAEIAEMSVREIQDALSGVQAEKFDTGAELRSLANDKSLSEVERAQFAQALEDYGAISGEQAEMEFQDLIDSMDGAETISFGDETYSIEQIFEDAEFTGVIKEYLDADEAGRQAMRETEGFEEFADFIDKHEEVLTQMTANIQVALDEGEELTAEGTAAKMSKDGATEIPDFVFEDYLGYVPDPSDLHNREWMEEIQNSSMYRMYYDPEQFAKDVGGLETADITKFIGLMGTLREIDPNFMARMDDMTEAELRKYIAPGPKDAEGNPTASLMEKTLSTQEDINHLSTMADTNTPEGAASFYAELGGDADTLQSLISTHVSAKKLGHKVDPATASFLKLIDADGDGKLDSADTIQQRIEGMGDTPFSQRLRDNGGAGITINASEALTAVAGAYAPGEGEAPTLNHLLLGALVDDKIDATEIEQFSQLTLAELMQFQDSYYDKIDNNAKGTLHNIVQAKELEEVDSHLNQLNGAWPGMAQETENLLRELNAPGQGWLGSRDPAMYQRFRQVASVYQQLKDSKALHGMPKHVQDYAENVLRWAATDHRSGASAGIQAFHPDNDKWIPDNVSEAYRDFASNSASLGNWMVWDTTQNPAKLIGAHDDPNVVAAWQEKVLSGEIPITDTSMISIEESKEAFHQATGVVL